METEKDIAMSSEQIKLRARRIRLDPGELGERANRSRNTVKTLLAGLGVHAHTHAAIVAALVAEEVQLRDYLIELHPLEPAENPT